jgi:hypothetical protein
MLFLCRWPNGDFSAVKACNKAEAIELLDEIGSAEGSPVTPINDDFMVHFVPTDDGDFELQEWGERTAELIMSRAYPVLLEARMEASTKANQCRITLESYAPSRHRQTRPDSSPNDYR